MHVRKSLYQHIKYNWRTLPRLGLKILITRVEIQHPAKCIGIEFCDQVILHAEASSQTLHLLDMKHPTNLLCPSVANVLATIEEAVIDIDQGDADALVVGARQDQEALRAKERGGNVVWVDP